MYEDEYCFTVWDRFPVSDGHSLIITRRHISSFFDTTTEEKTAILNALELIAVELAMDRIRIFLAVCADCR